jgi:hypothetical protein
MSYKVLTFEPKKVEKQTNPILWKAQMFPPSEYESVGVTLLNDNIEVNNRRTEEEWENLLTDNGFKYELNYDHEYCKEFIIFDTSCVAFSFQIFGCDINVGSYNVQIASDYILPTLYILNLEKEGNIFPQALMKRIEDANSCLPDNKANEDMLRILKSIGKLADECQLYEVDIHYKLHND